MTRIEFYEEVEKYKKKYAQYGDFESLDEEYRKDLSKIKDTSEYDACFLACTDRSAVLFARNEVARRERECGKQERERICREIERLIGW